ncbi:MAG: hypothetical protein IPN13_06975 [Bacteroidetes bacterium]|nr:hypothetical protein [Bacteroidota bacterium]
MRQLVQNQKENRPKMFYPILVDRESKEIILLKTTSSKAIYDSVSKTFDDKHLETIKKKYEADGFAVILFHKMMMAVTVGGVRVGV